MEKKLFVIILTAILLLSMSSCTADTKNVLSSLDDDSATVIQNDLDVFSEGDISAITESVFGIPADEASTDESGNGIIADLFANAEAQVAAADETTITYTIISPDISDFFYVMADEIQTITTTEELRAVLIEYANTAPKREFTVTLAYSTSDAGIKIAYDNPEFINAMTGGLLDAYADLYNQYLEGER